MVWALAASDLVIDCTVEGLLHSPELGQILAGGARVLMISNEHPEVFDRLHEVTEGTFTLKEHDVMGTDDHVVALSDMSAVRDGVRISVNVVSVMHFRDGRQQERWFHPSDPTAWDALLGGSA